MLKDQILPSAHLLQRSLIILGEVSLGLEIVAVEVFPMVQPTPAGLRPMWMITYLAKGGLIGPEHYITQMTGVDTPFITEEALRQGLTEGCALLREKKAQQLSIANGKGK